MSWWLIILLIAVGVGIAFFAMFVFVMVSLATLAADSESHNPYRDAPDEPFNYDPERRYPDW